VPAGTVRSFVTSGASLVAQRDGAGAMTWDGGDSDLGSYVLRVLSTRPAAGPCCVPSPSPYERRPRIAAADAAPNPFEPRPHHGDRDTRSRRHSIRVP
jgi:hypothetical protein